MATKPTPSGSAAIDLGYATSLPEQVKAETEEEKKKRLMGMSALQSPAAQMLLGGMGAR